VPGVAVGFGEGGEARQIGEQERVLADVTRLVDEAERNAILD
jgi:hypothetical protein